MAGLTVGTGSGSGLIIGSPHMAPTLLATLAFDS